jgi:predicted RNA-binding Zn ribbon-like protein
MSYPGAMNEAILLANTMCGGTDRLRTPAEMADWLDSEGAVLGDRPPEIALRVSEFRTLRDAVRELLRAASSGRSLPEEAVASVNRTSASVPTHVELDLQHPAVPRVAEVVPAVSTAALALARIARSAVRLLGTDAANALRACPAPGCGRFFLAARPDQVWCSPACGNRARVARHAARRRNPEGP